MTEARGSIPRQRVWPLFVAAFGLTLFGLYFVVADQSDGSASGRPVPGPFAADRPMPQIEPLLEPVQLHYRWGSRSSRVSLRQENRRGDAVTRAWIDASFDETPTDTDGRVVRHYTDVQLGVWSDDRAVGPEVSSEVERLLAITRQRVDRRPTGEVISETLLSSEASQLRQALALVRDGLAAARPRLPREAVVAGESWSWDLPVSVEAAPDRPRPTMAGKVTVRATVVGRDEHGAIVIQLAGDVGADGTLGGGADQTTVRMTGALQGWARVEAGGGVLLESFVRHEITAQFASERAASTLSVHFENE